MREKYFCNARRWLISIGLTLTVGLVLMAIGPSTRSDAEPVPHPNNLDRILYFNSDIRDAADCAITVEGKQISFGARVTNPSITCPDAFAWSLFARAIDQEFWRNWATDSQTWPPEPYPLCGAANDKGAGCCMPGNEKNPGYEDKTNPSQHCPFIPGDFDGANTTIIPHQANPQAAAQITAFHASMPVPGEEGRVIRQEVAEIVFRNEPFLDYVFANNLYNGPC